MVAKLHSSKIFGRQQKRTDGSAQLLSDYLIGDSAFGASTSGSTSIGTPTATGIAAAQQLDSPEYAAVMQRGRQGLSPFNSMLAWRGQRHAGLCAMLLLLVAGLVAPPAEATTMSWYCNSYSPPPNTPTSCPFCVPSAPCSVGHTLWLTFGHAWHSSPVRMHAGIPFLRIIPTRSSRRV